MEYKFFLNGVEVEEPIGFNDLELSMKRDDNYHGMQFLASTGTLRFIGDGGAYLRDQKETFGIFANVIFIAQQSCEGEFETIISGRLNFGKYKASCGRVCVVEIPFEEDGCKVVFNNRFDQKVDIDSLAGFDKMTPLPDYNQLKNVISIPAVALEAGVSGNVPTDRFLFECIFLYSNPNVTIFFRPDYEVITNDSIETGQLLAINNMESSLGSEQTDCINGPITPQLLLEQSEIDCFNGTFSYISRQKGILAATFQPDADTGPGKIKYIKQVIYLWDGFTGGSIIDGGDLVFETIIADYSADPVEAPIAIPFDSTVSGTTAIPEGYGFYSIFDVELENNDDFLFSYIKLSVDWDSDTSINISATKLCPDSECQYYLIHETLSRVAESITNKCIRAKSNYYGRIDSQPFSFDNDGCGSLRMFTSGLKLRNAPDGKFFASMKDLIEGLNAIDNIGFDIIEDTELPGRFILRIEPVSEFYQDIELISLDFIAESSNEIQESMHYAKINVGYEKWEVEKINGLNEFNSNREYRTNVETISTTKDIKSKLIAGSIPIEVTRQQSFADSGAADTTYDNDIFIICLERNVYDFIVEQNKILNPSNIFDPTTVLNYRISPVRNLMRWFKSIINTYPDIYSGSSKLFFNSGTGNFLASGTLDDNSLCRMEGAFIVNENIDVWVSLFQNQNENAKPLWKNETDSFEYPLSISQWNFLKNNPYGYISFTCGNDTQIKKGFIKEIKFRPVRGIANFILTRKWE